MQTEGLLTTAFFFQVKCEQYWDFGTKHFENITVTTTSDIPLEDWTIRDFNIKNASDDMRHILRKKPLGSVKINTVYQEKVISFKFIQHVCLNYLSNSYIN